MIKVLLVLFRRTCGHVDVCMYVCIYFISQAQDVSQMPYYEKYITISQLYESCNVAVLERGSLLNQHS